MRNSSFGAPLSGRRGDRASCAPGVPHALLETFAHVPKFAGWVGGRIRSDYTGHILRIRRASDDAEINIDAVSSANGRTNAAAIVAHCAGTTGYLVKLYDQSGNANDIAQADPTKQPVVYESGAVITGANGYLAARFDNVDDTLGRNDAFALTGDAAITAVGDFNGVGADYICRIGQTGTPDTPDVIGLWVSNDLPNAENYIELDIGDGFVSGTYGYLLYYVDEDELPVYWGQFSKAAGVGDLGPDTYQVRLNGEDVDFNEPSVEHGPPTTLNLADGGFEWGAHDTGDSNLRSNVIVWNAVLSAVEQAALDAWMADHHA